MIRSSRSTESSSSLKLSGAIAAVCVAATPGTQVLAQEAGAFLEEIVVTARKREENLQDVPVAVSVFTGESLQQAGILSTRDLFSNTPGLNYDTGFDQNAGTPAIRGVVSGEIATYRQKVTTFLDGMPILGQQGTVPFLAIQQVEVLRGPQSAAFGRSTFGGAINYTTRDPGEEYEAEFNVEVGSFSTLNADALFAGPIAGDTVSGLFAISTRTRDGMSEWRTVEEGVSLGGEDSTSALAKLLFTPNDNTTIELRYKWLETDHEQTPRVFLDLNDPIRVLHPDAVPQGQPCGGGIIPPPQPSCAFIGQIDRVSNEVYDYDYASTGIDDPFVRNERDRFEIEGTFDLDSGSSIQALAFVSDEYYERAIDADLTNNAFGFERDPTDIEETYAEVRYTSAGDQRFRYGVGISYYDYDFLTNLYRNRAGFDAGSPFRQIQESATNTGLFFNLTYDATDQLTLSFEGRYQDDDVSGTGVQDDGSLLTLGRATSTFLPRLSLTYAISDDTTFYAQISEGNNPAGVNSNTLDQTLVDSSAAFPNIFDNNAIALFDEETVVSYEIGLKGVISDRATYAVNLYALDWEGYVQPFNLNFEPGDFIDNDDDGLGDVGTIYEGLDFSPGRTFLEAGDVTGSGLEFEGNYFATDNLRLGAAISYIDITYDSGACSTVPTAFGVPTDTTTAAGLPCVSVSGNELRTQPEWAGSFNAQYNRPLSNGMDLFARWNTIFRTSQWASEMNLAELDGFSISDLRIGVSRDSWRTEFYIANIFDEDAPQGIQYFFDGRILTPAGTPAPPPFAQNIFYTGRRERNYGIRFSYRLGGQ